MYICDLYDSELRFYYQRHSNNSKPVFTDQEIMTIYLFAGHCQKYFLVKDIHSFAKEYLLSWFPHLPSYKTFNYRLNLLAEAFAVLSQRLIEPFKPVDCDSMISLVDSMPVITSAGRNRTGNVAPEITAKGYCSTKTQRNKAFNDLFSAAVSKIRQPIESLFNWLNEKTNIQRAMKVRSTSRLLVHTMGKIAIAFIYLIF